MTKPKKDPNAEKKGDDKCTPGSGCTKHDHSDQYGKKHEKGHFPRRVWPTDSEKKKGQKI